MVASVAAAALARVLDEGRRAARANLAGARRMGACRRAARRVRLLFILLLLPRRATRVPAGLATSTSGAGSTPASTRTRGTTIWAFSLYSSSGGLVWTEGLVLLLALIGLIAAAARSTSGFWPRYVALYSLITALVFSVVRYKTPWNLLPFYAGFVVLAGYGAAVLIDAVETSRGSRAGDHRARCRRLPPGLGELARELPLSGGSAQSVRLRADQPGLPAARAPRDGVSRRFSLNPHDMLVKVIAGPYEQWPLPVVLAPHDARRLLACAPPMPGRLDEAPVIVASQENVAALDAVARRSVRVGVLRPAAGRPADRLHRALALGSVPRVATRGQSHRLTVLHF